MQGEREGRSNEVNWKGNGWGISGQKRGIKERKRGGTKKRHRMGRMKEEASK